MSRLGFQQRYRPSVVSVPGRAKSAIAYSPREQTLTKLLLAIRRAPLRYRLVQEPSMRPYLTFGALASLSLTTLTPPGVVRPSQPVPGASSPDRAASRRRHGRKVRLAEPPRLQYRVSVDGKATKRVPGESKRFRSRSCGEWVGDRTRFAQVATRHGHDQSLSHARPSDGLAHRSRRRKSRCPVAHRRETRRPPLCRGKHFYRHQSELLRGHLDHSLVFGRAVEVDR